MLWCYQGILVELPLAGFFLKKLLRRGCDVNDLPTLDPELYRHLMLLREMSDPAAVDALSLTFTVADSELDEHREVRSGSHQARMLSMHTPFGAHVGMQVRVGRQRTSVGLPPP